MVSAVGECVFCVLSFGKTLRRSDSGNTEWSRMEKPHGDNKIF